MPKEYSFSMKYVIKTAKKKQMSADMLAGRIASKFGEKARISSTAIRDYLREDREPTPTKLINMCAVLGINPDSRAIWLVKEK